MGYGVHFWDKGPGVQPLYSPAISEPAVGMVIRGQCSLASRSCTVRMKRPLASPDLRLPSQWEHPAENPRLHPYAGGSQEGLKDIEYHPVLPLPISLLKNKPREKRKREGRKRKEREKGGRMGWKEGKVEMKKQKRSPFGKCRTLA